MNVNNVGGNSPVQKIVTNPIQKQVPSDAPPSLRASDRLDITGASHLLKTLQSNDVRVDKVAALKAQIDSGAYDADGKKLDSAIDKMMDDVLK